jgi:catechol 2,3-dioxygenase-like lactoylglutathione lyase family enzyme
LNALKTVHFCTDFVPTLAVVGSDALLAAYKAPRLSGASTCVGFYRDTLGLTVAHEDSFAAVFNIAGITLRVSIVADFTPHEHTILGFSVPDVPATVKALRDKGVTFNIYQGVSQDELGVWTAPGATVRVAWLKDPDGNVLSVTNA